MPRIHQWRSAGRYNTAYGSQAFARTDAGKMVPRREHSDARDPGLRAPRRGALRPGEDRPVRFVRLRYAARRQRRGHPVVMPARSQLRAAFRIDVTCEPCFPLDIIVRTPENMRWRLEEGDSFLREIVSRGKVLYEKADARVGKKGRSGSRPSSRRKPPRRAGA